MTEKKLEDMTTDEIEQLSEEEVTKLNEDVQDLSDVEDVEADTDTETSEEDDQTTDSSDVDTETETPDYVKLFNDAGLNKQFPGGLSEMFERMPETNKYLRELQEENKKYRDYVIEQTKKPDKPVDVPDNEDTSDFSDQFYDDPKKALVDQGFIEKESFDDTNRRVENVENTLIYNQISNVIGEYDDLKDIAKDYLLQKEPEAGKNAIWDTFIGLLDKYPGLDKAPLSTKLDLLFDKAKSMVVGANKPKPPVKPVSNNKKDVAKTHTPSSDGVGDTPDYEKMPTDELLEYAKTRNLVDS